MGVLSRIVSRWSDESNAQQQVSPGLLEAMTLPELLTRAAALEDAAGAESVSLYRRLLDFALFDPGHGNRERERALNQAFALKVNILEGMRGDPAAKAAFEESSSARIGEARFYGFGSLQWLIAEYGVPAEDLPEFVVRPQFAELLPDYLATLPPEQLGECRYALVRRMIEARREEDAQTDLQVLAALVFGRDAAVEILLTREELALMRNARDEHDAVGLLDLIKGSPQGIETRIPA